MVWLHFEELAMLVSIVRVTLGTDFVEGPLRVVEAMFGALRCGFSYIESLPSLKQLLGGK